MNRRQFLKLNAIAFAGITSAYATNHNKHAYHAMVDTPINHASSDISNISSQNIPSSSPIIIETNPITLLDKNLFPKHHTLKTLPLLKNQSKQKGIFKAVIEISEKQIEFIKGKPTLCYTYNGLVPGPKIEVQEGDYVEILVKNRLKEETTIHWHGLPVPPDQDGAPHDAILPGQERYYKFTLPKGFSGTFWYHPHPHYKTAKQVFMGLAGAFVVKARDSLSDLQEQDWLISDLRLDENAQIPNNTINDWMNGREGEFVLINGQLQPKITINGTQRIRVYNLCSARFIMLHIPGCTLHIVGKDGGLMERPLLQQDSILITPAQRLEIIVNAPKNGQYTLKSLYYDRKKMPRDKPYTIDLADINIENQIPIKLPEKLRDIEDIGKVTAYQKVVFSEEEDMPDDTHAMASMLLSMFFINEKTFDMNRVDFYSNVHEVEEWEIFNEADMDHPFHIHGTQFEVVSSTINNVTTIPSIRCLQDTINVRPQETIKLKMKQDFKGLRMLHCHILEHEDLGMMSHLKVM